MRYATDDRAQQKAGHLALNMKWTTSSVERIDCRVAKAKAFVIPRSLCLQLYLQKHGNVSEIYISKKIVRWHQEVLEKTSLDAEIGVVDDGDELAMLVDNECQGITDYVSAVHPI